MNLQSNHEFYGTDLKSELIAGFFTAIIQLLVWALGVYFFYSIHDLEHVTKVPRKLFIASASFALIPSLLFLRFYGKRISSKWSILLDREKISIQFKKRKKTLYFKDIKKVVINGGPIILYISLKSRQKNIRIRVGAGLFAPFSRFEDMEKAHHFLKSLEAHLKNDFIKKDRRLSIAPEGTIKISYLKK